MWTVIITALTLAALLIWQPWLSDSERALKQRYELAEWEAREAECRTPKAVAEKDGVILYKMQEKCGGQAVYFSRSGTSWETVERSGKVTRRVQHQVPNTEP